MPTGTSSQTGVQPLQKRKTPDQQYRDLKLKAEKLGFVIQHSKFCVSRPGNVPTEHQARFEHIQTLGKVEFDSYGLQPSPDTVDKPWQLENKGKANGIRQKAIKCREETTNEAKWRFEVEAKLFERFEIEVACYDPGLSPIFSSRIQSRNCLPREHETNSNAVTKEPDRVHGLQSTASLEKLLQQRSGAQSLLNSEPSQRLADILQTSCNPDDSGKRLLFPFLVMEAKRGRQGGDFDEVEIQTAHPIRHLLVLQWELHQNEFNQMKMPGGPLAWFLANVGEIWRVYGCYVDPSGDRSRPSWNTILLWQGSITGYDEALQLTLIIDYILDWARDTYRPSIIRQLKCIGARGANSNYTVTHDSDIFSMMNPIGEWLGAQGAQTAVPTIVATNFTDMREHATEDDSAESLFNLSGGKQVNVEELLASIREPVRKLVNTSKDERAWRHPIHSSRYGRVRLGTALESRVYGVYITADNIGTMLQGFGGYHAQRNLADKIDKIVRTRTRCFALDNAQALGRMERIWTGDSTYSLALSHPTLISIQVRFWVTYKFELIRELNYLAITEEAYNSLSFSRRRKNLGISRMNHWKPISADHLVSFLEDKDNTFKEDFFLRCLKSQVLVLHHSSHLEFRPDARLRGTQGPVAELVSEIYEKHRIGQRKPDEAFIKELETIENILPTPEHAFWSANKKGILARDMTSDLCLYIPDSSLALNRAENLASRFSLDKKVFRNCVTSRHGGADRHGSEDWPSLNCGLQELASWIMEDRPKRDQLKEIQSAFPSITDFNKFMEFRHEHRRGRGRNYKFSSSDY
ncbi:uncharacterized protein ALTATR162_LOCUS6885 [Alternaria atra]|uniref:Uncharacterized protein n=1 Tax=Alternaria atra TaxID=119953 RepID=A0A8J2I4V2_9PLEO|nr:uncharacterized protein ALTATR162_LOCUS6885 [Alternaria atra]CAG5166119.1 unnamed protein product [Alternaria atra]